jgi:hypothetical protein
MCGAAKSGQRGAGVHAPEADFTFRTYCQLTGTYPETVGWEVGAESPAKMPCQYNGEVRTR